MKFKKGDKVKIRPGTEFYVENSKMNPRDMEGTVLKTNLSSDFPLSVKWENGNINYYRNSDLELVESAELNYAAF